jgi:hypothetical protein
VPRWYRVGRYERECEEYQRWRDNWEGVERWRSADGRTVVERRPCGWLFTEPGYDANGSPVE